MAKQAAKGWTHPHHWKVAIVGTLCQILAAAFIITAVATPFFTDRRAKPDSLSFKLTDTNIKCEREYCYNSEEKMAADPKSGQMRRHALQLNKEEPAWLRVAQGLLLVGTVSNLLSLALLLLVFWPVVMAGRALNILLHICRAVDFFGAPTKFLGAFFFIWYIAEINASYTWWRYDGLLQLDPLPLGLVLFSYILQTLCFVCGTLATDRGARGQESHIEILKRQHMFAGVDEDEQFRRVSYHPIDTKRSSKVLAEVESKFTHHESNV